MTTEELKEAEVYVCDKVCNMSKKCKRHKCKEVCQRTKGCEDVFMRKNDANCYLWPFGLVAMIPALGAGGPGFKSRNGPTF